ncbi:MarR family transcriptional regulator [Blastococcus sp. MG754426]|uniref:MarR family winged helix-turn-helix transcriptional regulator n=1 Tax=unclassified Blastococcus TaxID=2619396 RepID=UPI001EF033F4|nr:MULTISPECIES: MarR family transcriptional regulator [unclassified Blastococcus]MCF6507914.1 MarR family transcriptional regulator [Blastococcus sp. MG754426]MCF6512496.1 MarR family transcriptional regulator [Blastococcus sp. MG754427]
MSADVAVFDRLLEIALLVQADMARELEPAGLTPARTHLLWEVHRRGPSSQRALATALDVTPRNVTGLVDALEERGYVRREPHPTDRRITLVTLTDLGVRTTAQMDADHRRIAAHLVDGFDPARLERFRADLDAVAARLHELMDPEARP